MSIREELRRAVKPLASDSAFITTVEELVREFGPEVLKGMKVWRRR